MINVDEKVINMKFCFNMIWNKICLFMLIDDYKFHYLNWLGTENVWLKQQSLSKSNKRFVSFIKNTIKKQSPQHKRLDIRTVKRDKTTNRKHIIIYIPLRHGYSKNKTNGN